MRLYLDTEFNGFGGELISMALVSDGASEWYEVCPTVVTEPWVRQHVVPVLGKEPMRSMALFRSSFHQFIRAFKHAEIICDWPADAVHFCTMLAGVDYGSSLELPFTLRVIITPPGQPVSKVPHNALEDARALRTYWNECLAGVAA